MEPINVEEISTIFEKSLPKNRRQKEMRNPRLKLTLAEGGIMLD